MPAECSIRVSDGSFCNQPQYSDSSTLCERHFADRYPSTYHRLKKEYRCRCHGTKWDCPECHGRGWINPTVPKSEIKAPPPPMTEAERYAQEMQDLRNKQAQKEMGAPDAGTDASGI